MERVVASVRHVEGLVERQILDRDARILRQAKESTVGASSVKTAIPDSGQPSMVKTVLEYLENQRASLLPRDNAEPQYEDVVGSSVIDEPNNNAVPIAGPCGDIDSDKTTTRQCSHCGGPWFCSVRCEEIATYSHRFSCNRRPITTADLLEKDCCWDSLPEDPQVREDCGFQRCRNRSEETKLFGLYVGIIKYNNISSEELHRWRTEAILVDKIIKVFARIPEGSRGGYYPWFLRNRHILEGEQEVINDEDDVDKYIQERYAEARAYLDPADQTKAVEDLTPFAKQYCFFFFSMLLDCKYPPPKNGAPRPLWLLLGNKPARDHFRSLRMEHLTPSDFPTCSFTDFWKAWEVGSLMEPFSRYGTSQGAANYRTTLDWRFPALREFLSYPGKSPRPSVWRLKHFLAGEDANVLTITPEIAAAAMEYGFHPQLDTRTRLDLRDFYTRVFRRGLLPREIDEAKRKRNMREMADRWSGGNVSGEVKQVLRDVSDIVARRSRAA
ncbi:hypothetical protein GJ744_011766 [Endocarpon pusillum]|uniref:Suppressor of anucleate metulae protein B n=1 Tax=Endocarpon pusillum TaxID=364733 RepID=A0A8H7E1Y2_9EURO|nr:hypothetical protein GJ744_011766 [Endocarpon pusillum]